MPPPPVGQFVRSVDHLREATGAHVMVIHHSGKDASKGARGSGSLRAAADTEVELNRDGDTIMAEQRKQRDMPCDGVFAYTLKSVFLGMDDDGDRVTSAVVEVADVVIRKPKARLTGTDKIGMQALSDALAEYGVVKNGEMFPRCPADRRRGDGQAGPAGQTGRGAADASVRPRRQGAGLRGDAASLCHGERGRAGRRDPERRADLRGLAGVTE